MAEWKKALVSETTKLKKLQKDLQKDARIKNCSLKKGKELIKTSSGIENSETLYNIFALKLLNYLLENESKLEIYNDVLLKKVINFRNEDKNKIPKKIYEEYKKIKDEIKKAKYNNKKWVKAIPNKLKKQATHLMGESKLKSLSAKNEKILKQMADENRLTVSDFITALRYKLTNEYLGTITEQIYKKNQDIFCNELQFFYSGFNFSKEKRQSEIKKIFDSYINIVNQINNEKEINLIVDNKNNIAKKIKLKSYRDFKNDSKSFFDKYNQFVDEVERRQVIRNRWLKNVEGTIAYQDIILKLNEDDILTTLIPARRKLLKEIENELINNNQSKYLFNAFKLIKKEEYSKQLPSDFIYIIALYQYEYSYWYYNENMDKNYYILESTKEKIDGIVSDYLKTKPKRLYPKFPSKPLPPLPSSPPPPIRAKYKENHNNH
ncbi:MAG: hypothetical protein IJG00_05960 [Clostridia bacterium]|nr:hypothetical protein [Clostridia bacterium]